MKILNLHLNNINSLAGETRIDFEQAPFKDSGVFAITGPNGSGKSSILDVITLGLYGETFRFNRPAEYVMTKHTGESFAAVEFALGTKKYRSSWQVQRTGLKPDAELQPPIMKLTNLINGEVLADNPQQVCTRITELTGMNFRNFTRSILLAQGDFAAFLNALDSERMDILERIVSADIYADYQQEVTDNAQKAQQAVDHLKQSLAAITVLEPAQIEGHEHDLADYQEQYAELEASLKSLEGQQTSLKNTAILHHRSAGTQKSLLLLQADLTNTEAELGQVMAARHAEIYQADLLELEQKEIALRQSKQILVDYQNELQHLKKRLGEAELPTGIDDKSVAEQRQAIDATRSEINALRAASQSEMLLWQSLGSQINEKKEALAIVDIWLEEHNSDSTLLDKFPETARLKRLRTELAGLTLKQKTLDKTAKHSQTSAKSMAAVLMKEINKTSSLKEQMADDGQAMEKLLQGYDPETIDELKAYQQERVKSFEELAELADSYEKLSDKPSGWLSGFSRKKVVAQLDPDELAKDLVQLQQDIKREENIKLTLEELVTREAMWKKMAADRVHLVDGKPCPLCGALNHPYGKRPPAIANARQAFADQQAKLKALKTSAERLAQQINIAEKNRDQNIAKQNRMRQLKSQWITLGNRLNIAGAELAIENPRSIRQLAHEAKEELKNISDLVKKYHAKKANIAKLTQMLTDNAALIAQLQIDNQQLETNNQSQTAEQMAVAEAVNKCRQEEQELTTLMMEQLAMLGEKMPGKGKEDAFFDRLNLRRQEYQTYHLRRKNLTDEIAGMEAKQVACQTEIARCNVELERYLTQLQGEESIGLHLAILEKQRLLTDHRQILSRQEDEFKHLQQTLLSNLQNTQFNSLQALSDALELLANQPELELQQADLTQKVAVCTDALQHDAALLENTLSLAEVMANLDDIYQQLNQIVEKLDISKLEIQRLERLLAQQRQLLENRSALAVQLHQQEMAAQPYLAELELLKAGQGMEFRRRVRTRLADKLIAQTNKILEKSSGRYYLRQAISEHGLALEIEDILQGNARRLPKTLSGGESFVVSLALALGLSELAANGKSVDSLFLDEGFGNLDAESLFTVISTLENLQTQGKTVGVISHVEAVQKRIKVQLQVVKKPDGLGELRKAS